MEWIVPWRPKRHHDLGEEKDTCLSVQAHGEKPMFILAASVFAWGPQQQPGETIDRVRGNVTTLRRARDASDTHLVRKEVGRILSIPTGPVILDRSTAHVRFRRVIRYFVDAERRIAHLPAGGRTWQKYEKLNACPTVGRGYDRARLGTR